MLDAMFSMYMISEILVLFGSVCTWCLRKLWCDLEGYNAHMTLTQCSVQLRMCGGKKGS